MKNQKSIVLNLLWNDYLYNIVFIQLDGTLQKPEDFFYLHIKNAVRLNLMTIFYYLYNNNRGENKPQNSPNLESATFDNPWPSLLHGWFSWLQIESSSQGRGRRANN